MYIEYSIWVEIFFLSSAANVWIMKLCIWSTSHFIHYKANTSYQYVWLLLKVWAMTSQKLFLLLASILYLYQFLITEVHTKWVTCIKSPHPTTRTWLKLSCLLQTFKNIFFFFFQLYFYFQRHITEGNQWLFKVFLPHNQYEYLH